MVPGETRGNEAPESGFAGANRKSLHAHGDPAGHGDGAPLWLMCQTDIHVDKTNCDLQLTPYVKTS